MKVNITQKLMNCKVSRRSNQIQYAKKYGLDHKLVRLLVEIDFDLEVHYIMKFNGICFSYKLCGEQKSFIEKQKEQEELYIVPIHPKSLQSEFHILKEIDNIEDRLSNSSSYDLFSSSSTSSQNYDFICKMLKV